MKKTNLEKATTEKEKTETISHNLKGNELYNKGFSKGENAGLLSF